MDTEGFTQGCRGSLQQKHIESTSSSHPKWALVSQTAGFLSSSSGPNPKPACRQQEGIARTPRLHFRETPQVLPECPRDAGKPKPWAQPGSCTRDTWPCSKQPGRAKQKLLRIIQTLQRTVLLIKGPLFPSRMGTWPLRWATRCTAPADRQ